MDCSSFELVKSEKSKATPRFSHLGSIAFAFRTLEFALVLILLSWTLNRVPLAVKLTGEIVRQLAGSPLFVFTLCNGIIVAILAKSGQNHQHNAETGIYDEIIKNSSVAGAGSDGGGDRAVVSEKERETAAEEFEYIIKNSNFAGGGVAGDSTGDRAVVSEKQRETTTSEGFETGEVVVYYQDKWIISEAVNTCGVNTITCVDDVEDSCTNHDNPRVYRRSKSEKLRKGDQKVLRRSETERGGKTAWIAAEETTEDELSNEEFQQTIETFIAKQLQFRRQESMSKSMAIVVHNQS